MKSSSGRSTAGQSGVWTLYVGNPPEHIHWQGLWQVFDRHGRVLDSFIPQKRALFRFSADGFREGSAVGKRLSSWQMDIWVAY
ncbi:hypothetical protein V6N13_096761 [Hibiscus sabdariffa]